jgi:hypothetical protein
MSVSIFFDYMVLKMEAVYSSNSRYIFLRQHIPEDSRLQIACMGSEINYRNLLERWMEEYVIKCFPFVPILSTAGVMADSGCLYDKRATRSGVIKERPCNYEFFLIVQGTLWNGDISTMHNSIL